MKELRQFVPVASLAYPAQAQVVRIVMEHMATAGACVKQTGHFFGEPDPNLPPI
jgi:hypothetical protein